MGLTGPHFLGNSDGLDHYSFRIRFRTRMERPTVADSGFGMAPVRFVHHQQGSDGARAVLRGILEGAYGVLIFYTIVAGGLGFLPSFLVYAAAIFASLIVSLPWLKGKLVLPAE
jgi:hypothetical protein